MFDSVSYISIQWSMILASASLCEWWEHPLNLLHLPLHPCQISDSIALKLQNICLYRVPLCIWWFLPLVKPKFDKLRFVSIICHGTFPVWCWSVWVWDQKSFRCSTLFVPIELNWVFLSVLICICYKNSEYDQEIPQSQTADNPVAPRGRAVQPSRDTRKTN